MRTVLFVAAEAREFLGLLRKNTTLALGWPVDFARKASLRGVEAYLIANGPGPRLAASAVTEALKHIRPDAIVSTGMCGGLSPKLKVGEVLVADRVMDDTGHDYTAGGVDATRPFAAGTLISMDRVATSVSDKRSLYERGAVAVEMEAAGVARCASENKIPFFCVRSVSDTADEDLVLDFNAFRDNEGRFSRLRVVAAALRRPWTCVPGLIRLDRNTRLAAEALGDFLVDCRF